MLNGDDNENSKKLIGFSSKTTTMHVQHNYTFFYISLPLLHVLWRKCRMCSQIVFFLIFFFLHCCSFNFHLTGRQHFSFSHRHYIIFILFFQRNSSSLFFISRSSSFSVIHVSVDIIKIQSEKKRTRLKFVVVFSLTVRVAM